MSAWIVSKAHITLLTEALFRYEVVSPEDGTPDAVGQMLWKENHRSINARDEEHRRTPRYQHASTRRCTGHSYAPGTDIASSAQALTRQHGVLLKQIACYEYQSCEHAGWKTSRAAALMATLTEAVCRSAGLDAETFHETQAWDNAPWGID